MQVRLGPNRVGPKGWLQPVADAVKLMFKELIVPAGANRALFVLAPVISLTSALAAWAVVPFSDFLVIADVNAGLLYVLAMTSLGVYGVIIAGWASTGSGLPLAWTCSRNRHRSSRSPYNAGSDSRWPNHRPIAGAG